MPSRPNPDIQGAVRALYASDPEREWARLERHRTEHAVTLKALSEHLPPPPARILDCGGGPGRYAIALAQQGYLVTLYDLSPELLELARDKATEACIQLEGIAQGSATNLSRYADASFDAILLMGPLYHLLDADERHRALVEACRVVIPGGLVIASFLARYAGHIDAIAHYPERAAQSPDLYRRIARTGLLPPREGSAPGFVAYFAHPSELGPLCHGAGLDIVEVLACEGIASAREDRVNLLTEDDWRFWVDVNYELAHDASTHGGAEHLLAICRRPRWRAVLKDLVLELDRHGIAYRLVGSAALHLRGIPIQVHDLDLEMGVADVYRLQDLHREHVQKPVAWVEAPDVRSHIGRLEIDSVTVEIIAGLERRIEGTWLSSDLATDDAVMVDGAKVHALTLEAETAAYLRQGRLDRAAQALPYCDPVRLRAALCTTFGRDTPQHPRLGPA
jgi:SAM-dependent methyltransferase